jgi:hypothetical protein
VNHDVFFVMVHETEFRMEMIPSVEAHRSRIALLLCYSDFTFLFTMGNVTPGRGESFPGCVCPFFLFVPTLQRACFLNEGVLPPVEARASWDVYALVFGMSVVVWTVEVVLKGLAN